MPASPPFRVEITEAATTVDLRRRVLRPGLAADVAMPGDEIRDAVHVAAFVGELPVSACLVYPEPCPWCEGVAARAAWRLRSMASDPARRRLGAGRAVLAAAERVAADAAAPVVWCYARDSAVGFYRAAGWLSHGELFEVGAIGAHLRMCKPLARA
jgi:GNAT superfamily N-acetyltransferase